MAVAGRVETRTRGGEREREGYVWGDAAALRRGREGPSSPCEVMYNLEEREKRWEMDGRWIREGGREREEEEEERESDKVLAGKKKADELTDVPTFYYYYC